MKKFRKKPIEVEAIRWTGGDTGLLDALCGLQWSRADVRDIAWPHSDEEQVVVYNFLEKQWLCCPVGHWIIRGLKCELYPCDPEIFAATYDPV